MAVPLNVVASGAITTNGQTVAMTAFLLATGTVQVSGTWTGTLAFEATVDGTIWGALAMTPLAGGASVTGATASGAWAANIEALIAIRVRATAVMTGSATVALAGSSQLYTALVAPGGLNPGSIPYANASGALAGDGATLNVKGFLAKGDGVTDDTAAFNAAHTAAKAAGGIVFVPPGSYAVTSVAVKVPMFGAGETATLIYGSGNQDTLAVNVGGGTRLFNVTLADFSLLAKTDQSAGAALALDNVGYFKAHRVTVSNAGGGKLYRPLRIDSGSDLRFAACRFTAGAAASRAEVTSTAKNVVELYFDDQCEFNTGDDNGLDLILSANSPASIEGIHFAAVTYNNAGHGLYLRNNGTGRFGSIRCYGNPNSDSNRKSGFYADPAGTGVIQDVQICNIWCSFNNNPGLTSPSPTTGPGAYFGAGVDNLLIDGGLVNLSGGHGIQIDGAKNARVRNVEFKNNGQGGGGGGVSTYFGIAITGTSDDVEVATCSFVQDPNPARSGDPFKQNGVSVAATATNVKVHDNDMTGLGSGTTALLMPITYSGAATKWQEWDNKINLTNERGLRTSGSALIGTGGDFASAFGLHVVGGQAKYSAVATAVVGSIANQGTAGATSYWYWVMVQDRSQVNTLNSGSLSTTTGNATLDGTNFNRVSWTAVPGAARYYLFRNTTSTFLTTNNIAIVNANVGDATITFDDTGVALLGTVTPPGRNATADVFGDGYIAPAIQGAGMSTTAVATATAGTVAVAPTVSRVKPTGAITGVILATPSTVPTNNAPYVTVVNESAFSVTFDVVGTSHVANGVSCVIAALTAKHFVWDASAATPAWYPTS